MAVSALQNFYKEQIAVTTGAGAGNIYVTTKPVPTNGFLVISPGSESLREIVKYTGTGTDGNGDYVTVANIADRGLGGTTAQAHEVGEPIRMNYTAEHQKEIDDTIEAIVNNGAPLASTSVAGRSKLSTAPASAGDPIAVGDNDPRLPNTDLQAAQAGGGDFGTPSASNKFVTEDWFDVNNALDVQEFTASGNWTKPVKGTVALVEIWGAGGSGGARSGGSSERRGAGGGGGAYRRFFIRKEKLNATESVVIGTGGVARVQSTAGQTAGQNGGNTSFKGVSANGGAGGAADSGSGTATPGAGGAGESWGEAGGGGSETGSTSGTLFSAPGGAGSFSATSSSGAGTGGASLFGEGVGGNGASSHTGGSPTATAGTRGGGGGGACTDSGTATSGAGGNGFCRVTVF